MVCSLILYGHLLFSCGSLLQTMCNLCQYTDPVYNNLCTVLFTSKQSFKLATEINRPQNKWYIYIYKVYTAEQKIQVILFYPLHDWFKHYGGQKRLWKKQNKQWYIHNNHTFSTKLVDLKG